MMKVLLGCMIAVGIMYGCVIAVASEKTIITHQDGTQTIYESEGILDKLMD
jgi:hypothetical protein